jgi:hypothetical protein
LCLFRCFIIIIDQELHAIAILSYRFALRTIDRIFYYFGYLQYFSLKFALLMCFSNSPLPKLIQIAGLLLFPIFLLGISIIVILMGFLSEGTIDVIRLQWLNNKFLNNLCSDVNGTLKITNKTKFVWSIYYFETALQGSEVTDPSIVDKIMYTFQHGVSTFNAVEMSNMLKALNEQSTPHFDDEQISQQVSQIVHMVSKANELSHEHTSQIQDTHELHLRTSLTVAAKLDQLYEVMNESQTVCNVRVKDMVSEVNQKLDLLQLQEMNTTSLLKKLSQLDGSIREEEYGSFAAVRTEDGFFNDILTRQIYQMNINICTIMV